MSFYCYYYCCCCLEGDDVDVGVDGDYHAAGFDDDDGVAVGDYDGC